VNAPPAPAVYFIEHGGKNGNARHSVQNRRNSQPKKIHNDVYLKA